MDYQKDTKKNSDNKELVEIEGIKSEWERLEQKLQNGEEIHDLDSEEIDKILDTVTEKTGLVKRSSIFPTKRYFLILTRPKNPKDKRQVVGFCPYPNSVGFFKNIKKEIYKEAERDWEKRIKKSIKKEIIWTIFLMIIFIGSLFLSFYIGCIWGRNK